MNRDEKSKELNKLITYYLSNYDKNTQDYGPINGDKDIKILNMLVKKQKYVILPYIENNKLIHIYTLGLFYYYDEPEILITINTNNTMTEDLFDKFYHEFILIIDIIRENKDKLRHIDEIVNVNSDVINDQRTNYLTWFYSYYSVAKNIDIPFQINEYEIKGDTYEIMDDVLDYYSRNKFENEGSDSTSEVSEISENSEDNNNE